jgi:hypothetical protein
MRRLVAIAVVLAAAGAAVLGKAHFAPDEQGGVSVRQARFAPGQERTRERGRASGREAFPGNVEYDGRIVFVRIRYNVGMSGGPDGGVFGNRFRGSRGEPPWAHDYPTSDTHLMKILKELTVADPRADASNVFTLDDPDLMDYPIAYMSEPGFWGMSDEEAKGLREYLQKGGFIIFDDFRQNDMYNLEQQMKRALPDLRWVALQPEQTIFNSFFEIKNFNFGYYGKETYYGLFEDNDPKKRVLAIAGHNQDLGEFWEFSDTGMMPVDLSNEAYKFGVNYFVYALIH